MRSSQPAVFFSSLLLALFLLAQAGCRQTAARPLERVAIPPFENLTGDPGWAWLGAAIPHLLVREGAGHPSLLPVATADEGAAPAVRARRAVRAYYSLQSGRLVVKAVLRDLDTVRTLMEASATLASPDAAGPVALSLATQLRTAGPQPAAALKGEAIAAFGKAINAPDANLRREFAEQAWKLDPRFGAAAILLAQVRGAAGDPGGARQIYAESLRQSTGADEAQLRLSLAGLSGNTSEQIEALQAALRAFPAQTDSMRQLADLLLLRRNAPEAVRWLTEAVRMEPGHIDFRNTLAYAQAVARQFDAALATAAEYRRLAPGDPNAYDTSGEIAWMAGRFPEAEQYFLEAQAKSPQFLGGLEFSKAALARFLAGDTAGADQLFSRYIETRRAANDPYADLRQAHWLLLTGRAAAAEPRIAALAGGAGDPAARAGVLQALAHLTEGRREAAAQTARAALSQASTPQTVTAGATVVLLASPSAPPAEWNTRVDRAVNPQTPVRNKRLLLGYALLLDRHPREAAAALREVFDSTLPTEADESRMLLARARLDAGDKRAAVELLAIAPLPPQPGEALLASLYFPQFREWRRAAGS